MTLEHMARLWFDRSPLQHGVIVRTIINNRKNEESPSLNLGRAVKAIQ
jgi:hypothetical protein